MKKMFLLLTVLFGALLFLPASGSADPQAGQNFIVHLSGKDEVPPNNSLAQGQTHFQLSDDGMTLSYKLTAANINNVTMSHIHLAAAGANGPVVVWLYPSAPPPVLIPGKFSGVLAEGAITAANLVGPLAGQPLSALLDKMRAGEAYVNVHTNLFPAGEIRGQIRWPLAMRPVIPRPHAFTGGDYWVVHLNASRGLLRNPDGTFRDPSTYTEADWAQVRAGTGYYLGWGFKFQFSAPVAGSGMVTIIVNGTEHRHKVDQTGCPDCGIVPGSPPTTTPYTIAPDNRLTITDPVRGTFRGAFSRDFNILTAAQMEGRDAGNDMIMGVKAATTAQTVSGLYAMNGYGVDISYPYDAGIPGFSPMANFLSIGASLGWADISLTGGGLEFTSRTNINDPALTTAFANAATYSRSISSPGVGSLPIGPDGTYTDTTNEGDWLAVSPDGEVAIEASGINDIDPRFTDATNERHHESYGLLLKQALAGTYNRARLAGTYILTGRWDDVRIDSPSPITDCHVGPDAELGSISCGTGIRQTQGTNYGEFTLTAAGSLTFNINEVTDLGVMTTDTGTGTFTVETECYGFVGGVRLLLTDPVCTGGRMLDVVVGSDATGTALVNFFIADGGDVLTFFDPKSYDPASPSAGLSRTFGNAVRIR